MCWSPASFPDPSPTAGTPAPARGSPHESTVSRTRHAGFIRVVGARAATAAFAALLAASGCAGPAVHPPSQPIEPIATAAKIEARRLSDAGLRSFAGARPEFRDRSFPPAAWDLPSLAVAALYFTSTPAEAEAKVEEAKAAEITAGARPNPTFSFSPEVVLGSFSGVSPWTLGFALDVPIETAGKRGTRVVRACRATAVARLGAAEAAWRVRSRLRAALVDLLLAERKSDLAGREADLRAKYLDLVAKRFKVGEASRPDVQAAESDALQTKVASAGAAGRVAEARTGLAAAIGVPAAALDGAALSWPTLEAPPPPDAIPLAAAQRAGLLHRIDVRRALAEYAEAEADLQVEVAKQYPDVHLGPGYRFDRGDSKFALGLSVTLPLFDRNQGPIGEALARRHAGEVKFLALQVIC